MRAAKQLDLFDPELDQTQERQSIFEWAAKKLVEELDPDPVPVIEPLSWPPQPMIINTGQIRSHPCAFDGLPPGVYGLTCSCPKCSMQCVTEYTCGSLSATGNTPVVFT